MGEFLDIFFFPVRALLLPEAGKFGLSSLREERMSAVAGLCRGKVLDVGCGPGNLFIRDYIGAHRGIGIDVFPYHGVENIVSDMTKIPFADSSFDTVTLIAVGGHIPKKQREDEFREFVRLLKPAGVLIMTEGEPVTQFLVHKWASFYGHMRKRPDMDTVRGMADGEQYCLPRSELFHYLNTPPLKMIEIKHIMWGLNNIYIARKCD